MLVAGFNLPGAHLLRGGGRPGASKSSRGLLHLGAATSSALGKSIAEKTRGSFLKCFGRVLARWRTAGEGVEPQACSRVTGSKSAARRWWSGVGISSAYSNFGEHL